MALTTAFSNMDNNTWKTTLLFSALMEVVLALLYFLSACISIMSSTIIRYFHLRPPCFCTQSSGVVCENTRKQENRRKLLCEYHANKLLLLQNIILNKQSSSVHNLCEDCMLLKCTSTEEILFNVDSARDTGHIDERFSSLHAPFIVNNCRICSLRRHSSAMACISDQERLEENPGLQCEVGSEFGSSTTFTRFHSAPRCCCCKEFIRELRSKNEFVKEKFAKVYVDDFEGSSNESSSSETTSFPCYEAEQQEVMEQSFCKNYGKEDQDQKSDTLGDQPTSEPYTSLTNCERSPERQINSELQRQIGVIECKLHSDVLPEEDNDGKEDLLQEDSLDSTFCLITLSQEEQEDLQNNLDPELSSEMLMKIGETLESIMPVTTSEIYLEPVAIPSNDHAVAGEVPAVDPQSKSDYQKIEVDEVKELKDALESEKDAYNAILLELEEERNASAIAANETMAMISRLQEEKAAIQMESRQFKRMVDEKAAFDQEAIALLKDILCKREEEKLTLEKEVNLYRSRLFNCNVRKWRLQKWKSEDFQEHNSEEERLPEWDGHVLLLEGRKDDEMIKRTLKCQGIFEDNGGSPTSEYDYAETSRFPEDMGNVCPTTRQSFVPEEKSGFQEEEHKVIDGFHYDPMPAHSWEAQISMPIATESVPNSFVGGTGMLFSSSNLNEHDKTCMDIPLENSILCSQREDEERLSIGRSSLEGEDKFQLDSSTYIDDLDDCITIEVERTPISSTEHLNSQNDKAIPTLKERDEICNERYDIPSNLPDFEISHKNDQEELQPFDRQSTSHAENATSVDMEAGARGSYDMKLSKASAMPPGKIWHHRELKDNEHRDVFYKTTERVALTKEQTGDDDFDTDSLSSANELFPDCLDSRTGSMIKRDHQRTVLQEEVSQLSCQLQVLENDRHIMQNLIESFRPEDREISFSGDIELHLQQLHGFDGKLENRKRPIIFQEHTAFSEVLEDDRHGMQNVMESFRSEDREMPFSDDVGLQLQHLHGFDGKLENLKRPIISQESTQFPENTGKKQWH